MEQSSTIRQINWPTHYVLTLELDVPNVNAQHFEKYLEVLLSNDKGDVCLEGTLVQNASDQLLEVAVHMDLLADVASDWIMTIGVGEKVCLRPLKLKPAYSGPALFVAEGFGLTKYMSYFREPNMKPKLRASKLLLFNETELSAFWLTELVLLFGSSLSHKITRNQFDPNYIDSVDHRLLLSHYRPYLQTIYFHGSIKLYEKLFYNSSLKSRSVPDFIGTKIVV